MKTFLSRRRFLGALSAGYVSASAHLADTALADEPALDAIKLARGINLSHWFAQHHDYSASRLQRDFTGEDARLIASMGFDHVRFTVDPAPLLGLSSRHAEQSQLLDAGKVELHRAYLKLLDAAMETLLDAGLNVVVDIHPEDSLKLPLKDSDAHLAGFARLWSLLAGHMKKHEPSRVALELINEPRVEDGGRWHTVATELVKAIRQQTTRHVVIVASPAWSGIDQLVSMKPVEGDRLLHTFHMYDPFIFTHQGANWAGPQWEVLRNVPYPSSPEKIAPLLEKTTHAEARRNLQWYGEQRWNEQRINQEIARVAEWSTRHRAKVYCGEFGAYRRFAPREGRLQFTLDLRLALEKHRIGWAMWDYRGGFSLLKDPARREPDNELLAALGLKRK